jgi:hypothetical protein
MSDKLKYQLFYLACLWGGTALLWVMQGFWTAFAVFVMVGAAVIGNQDAKEEEEKSD